MPSGPSIFPSREIFIPAISLRMPSLSVLVVPAKPDVGLVSPPRRTVEPLVHVPEPVESAREGGIRVEDVSILKHEGAHAWSLAGVRRDVGSRHRREQSGPVG